MTGAEIAEVLGIALSTVSRWLRRIGLGTLGPGATGAPEPLEQKRPGELIHVDVKKLGRIGVGGAGHRVTGNRRGQLKVSREGLQRRATGWEFVHVCVDDATRLAYVEVLPDERGATAAGFLRRAVSWFAGMGWRWSASSPTTAPATAPAPTPRPAVSSACVISSPVPTALAPTARSSADDTTPSTTGRLQLGSPSWNNLVSSYS
ncbi:MAG: DDE-type integrase/transposase/recombinase [Actinobacteria bacterium]|nr:DDE-type integrase/transposase/recombinase [Actinomycetota bacterium]